MQYSRRPDNKRDKVRQKRRTSGHHKHLVRVRDCDLIGRMRMIEGSTARLAVLFVFDAFTGFGELKIPCSSSSVRP